MTISMPFKTPAVHLAWNHRINLKRINCEGVKVNLIGTVTLCKQNKVIKRMLVGKVKVFMHGKIQRKPADEYILLFKKG